MRRLIAVFTALLVLAISTTEARADDGGMRSPFAFGLGLFLAGVGGAGLGVGAHFYMDGKEPCDALPREGFPSMQQIDDCISGANRQVAGVVSMVAGGAFVLAGIPLIIVGAVPAGDSDRPRLVVQAEPGGGRLRVDF